MNDKDLIVLPNILLIPAYVHGLNQPLELVAEELGNQGKHELALALRYAGTICSTFARVNLLETHVLKI